MNNTQTPYPVTYSNSSFNSGFLDFDKIEPVESNEDVIQIMETQKPKRGRKRKERTIESELKTAQIRMERNRIFARQNRQRKKEYITCMETKVSNLL